MQDGCFLVESVKLSFRIATCTRHPLISGSQYVFKFLKRVGAGDIDNFVFAAGHRNQRDAMVRCVQRPEDVSVVRRMCVVRSHHAGLDIFTHYVEHFWWSVHRWILSKDGGER